MINLLLYLFIKPTNSNPLLVPCNGKNQVDCTDAKYCMWINSVCEYRTCYLIDDVSVCQQGGLLSGICNLAYTPPQFRPSCFQAQLTSQRVYYYRFVSDLSPEEISSTMATYSSLLSDIPSVDNLNKLYSLDILSSLYTDFIKILDLYLVYKDILIKKQSHPYYIERTIYEALQYIRDDFTQMKSQREQTLKTIWKIADILYKRLESFSDVHQTQYSFIHFNHIHLKYLKLETSIVTVTWDQYSNGFLRMTVLYAEIFGLISPVSPVFIITTSDGQILNYKIKWQLSTTLPIQLKQFDLRTYALYESPIKQTCSAGYCEADLQGAGSYVFTLAAVDGEDCSYITTREPCLIALCDWNSSPPESCS